jgi:hypothetical protein
MRLTPAEVRASAFGASQVGSSLLAGVKTKVLSGDPSKPGFYSIVLFVPAHTTIPAHSHRDDRMATVVSGTWQFGYGNRFDAKALKSLPPGSVYSEPAHSTTLRGRGKKKSWSHFRATVQRTRSTSIRRTARAPDRSIRAERPLRLRT